MVEYLDSIVNSADQIGRLSATLDLILKDIDDIMHSPLTPMATRRYYFKILDYLQLIGKYFPYYTAPEGAIKMLHLKVTTPQREEMTSISVVEVAHFTCACQTGTYVFFVPDRQQFIRITPTHLQYTGAYSMVIKGFEILPRNLAEPLKGIIVRNMALVLFRWVTGLDEGLVDTLVAQKILHKISEENEVNKK